MTLRELTRTVQSWEKWDENSQPGPIERLMNQMETVLFAPRIPRVIFRTKPSEPLKQFGSKTSQGRRHELGVAHHQSLCIDRRAGGPLVVDSLEGPQTTAQAAL
jgi:hypothetical protein